MRRRIIRTADIDEDLRETFEQYGTLGMQIVLALGGSFKHRGEHKTADDVRAPLLSWLTEKYDWETLKERMSLLMEFAVLVFVAMEVLPLHRVFSWICGKL